MWTAAMAAGPAAAAPGGHLGRTRQKSQAGPIEPFPVAQRRENRQAAPGAPPPGPVRPPAPPRARAKKGGRAGQRDRRARTRPPPREPGRAAPAQAAQTAVGGAAGAGADRVGLTLSVTVLFKVKEFRVENLDKTTPANTGIYTEDAILGAGGAAGRKYVPVFGKGKGTGHGGRAALP